MNEDLIKKIEAAFTARFGSLDGAKLYFAPGRVNLIGEHIDYSGGYVFPCALTIGSYCIAKPRADRKLRFYSINIPKADVIETSLDDLHPLMEKGMWTAYPKGVIWAMAQAGYACTKGLDVVYGGDVPNGSGLSSSASLEVVTAIMLRDLNGFDEAKLNNIELAKIGNVAENRYLGANTGILDQFASAMGRKDSAILLNCGTMEYEYAPISMRGKRIVVTNSNKPHSLVNSQYNTRRAQSDAARDALKKVIPGMVNLCDIDLKTFYEHADVITDKVIFKRAKHAISENQRTIDSLKALKAGDLNRFGDLINEAGESIRYDYEATGEETDLLVDAARIQPGVLCSRQTGGGWGGCTVSIVDDENIKDFMANVQRIYSARSHYHATFYVVDVGNGPEIIKQY